MIPADVQTRVDARSSNQTKLDACVGPHDFQPEEGATFSAALVCTKCGGETRPTHVAWYERGLAHGQAVKS